MSSDSVDGTLHHLLHLAQEARVRPLGHKALLLEPAVDARGNSSTVGRDEARAPEATARFRDAQAALAVRRSGLCPYTVRRGRCGAVLKQGGRPCPPAVEQAEQPQRPRLDEHHLVRVRATAGLGVGTRTSEGEVMASHSSASPAPRCRESRPAPPRRPPRDTRPAYWVEKWTILNLGSA